MEQPSRIPLRWVYYPKLLKFRKMLISRRDRVNALNIFVGGTMKRTDMKLRSLRMLSKRLEHCWLSALGRQARSSSRGALSTREEALP